MKEAIKRILKAIGLFELIKLVWLKQNKARRVLQRKYGSIHKKYRSINNWILDRRGVRVVYSTIDLHSKKWFFPRYDHGNIHEPVTTDLFIDHISKNSVVLDIGAHLGYFTCLAAKLAPNGKVHAFEVDPKCIPLITENLRLNNLENVIVNDSAVSDHNGFETIPLSKNPMPGLVINSSRRSADVKAIQIDEYVAANNISADFIKIDVEGAELKVLNGMSTVLNREYLTLLVEIHVDKLRDYFNTDYKEILSFLQNKGFSIQHIDSHRREESSMLPVDEESELVGNTMILCTKTTSSIA